jgi:hypothetical protein
MAYTDYTDWNFIRSPHDLPNKKLFAIITGDTIYIPGDERSRTNPGHGYPAETRPFVSLQVTEKEDVWKAKIAALSTSKDYSSQQFRAFIITPVDIGVTVSVDVKI